MKIYLHYGFDDFYILCGYKGNLLKEFFLNYQLYSKNLTVDFKNGKNIFTGKSKENRWRVTLLDTGLNSMTGGRILKFKKYLKKGENFLLTYGDGLTDINIKDLVKFHIVNKKLVTVSAVVQPPRWGSLLIKGNIVKKISEKSIDYNNRINGGFFVVNEKATEFIKNSKSIWEKEPLESLTKRNQLMAYRHNGFWMAMDTLRDKNYLNDLWNKRKAPWKLWK